MPWALQAGLLGGGHLLGATTHHRKRVELQIPELDTEYPTHHYRN